MSGPGDPGAHGALARGTNVAGVTNAVRGAAGEGSTLARALGVGNRYEMEDGRLRPHVG